MFSKIQFLTDSVKNPLSKIKASIKEIGKQIVYKQKIQSIEIVPNKLYYISYPTQNNIQSLQQQLRETNQFQLWNIGEYSYSEQILSKLLGQGARNSDGRQVVYNLTYQYFANIPFCEMIKSIQNIETFLSINQKNRVYIHCQQNKRRSAVFLASYIFLTGIQTDIVQSIMNVNKLLNISIEEKQIALNSPSSIYKSQHIILKNLMNYINNNSFINKNCWNLKKILINNAPKIHSVLKFPQNKKIVNKTNQIIKFKVLLQIRSIQGITYKKIFNDQFIQGQSLCLRIPQGGRVLLKDDFLIIIKYVYQKRGYSILRSQLNTNFIYDEYFRVQRNDMDLSVSNAHTKNETIFMDLILQEVSNQQSELSKLGILKDFSQKQSTTSPHEDDKSQKNKTVETQQKKTLQQQEDDFKILDQQQEAEHNQKMQRQIQEELARELYNLRKKKTVQSKKSQQDRKQHSQSIQAQLSSQKQLNSVDSVNLQINNQLDVTQTNEVRMSDQIYTEKNPKQTQQNELDLAERQLPIAKQADVAHQGQVTKEPTAENGQEQTQRVVSQEQQKADKKEESRSQQNQSSQSSQDQEEQDDQEQEQQEQQDLDDYLSKLQKQA